MEAIKNEELNIFRNEKFDGENKIAPKSKGVYKFCIENVTQENVTYNINFKEDTDYLVNMKYKLKIDNVYIKGNEETYININDLSVKDIIVLKDSINIYTLEWYWEDDDYNDTYAGSKKIDQYYKLNLEVEAQKYEKQI